MNVSHRNRLFMRSLLLRVIVKLPFYLGTNLI